MRPGHQALDDFQPFTDKPCRRKQRSGQDAQRDADEEVGDERAGDAVLAERVELRAGHRQVDVQQLVEEEEQQHDKHQNQCGNDLRQVPIIGRGDEQLANGAEQLAEGGEEFTDGGKAAKAENHDGQHTDHTA